jgi:serine/threonine protein kinase
MKTVINNTNQNSTRLNKTLIEQQSENLEGEKILGGKYTLFMRMNVVSGEADLYICTDTQGTRFVAKIYRRKDAVKPEVLETLRSLDSAYVAKIVDSGEYNAYPVIVLPYFRNGSLAGKTFDYGTIRNTIIPSVARGLKYLHENGIMHKDIKPSNLMISDDGERIEIIDFGISSVRDEGQSVLVTKTGLSPEYSAPETFNNVFLNESDYYSFGITLYELFTGGTPFSNMAGTLSADELAASASVQSIPFPESLAFPERLKLLIKGLTYRDLTHRNEPDNPNRRWGWNEVERWMNDDNLPVPGETGNPNYGNFTAASSQGSTFSQAYDFRNAEGKTVRLQNLSEFVDAFGTNWKDGKKQVGRGFVSDFFREQKLRSVASLVLDCEDAGVTDEAYSKMLMDISAGEGEGVFYWNNRKISSIKEIAEYLNDNLLNGTASENEYGSVMSVINYWCELNHKDNELQALDRIRKISDAQGYDLRLRIISFSSFFCPAMRLKIGTGVFENVSELKSYADRLKKSAPQEYFKWVADNTGDIEVYGKCQQFNSLMNGFLADLRNENERIRREREERERKEEQERKRREEQERKRREEQERKRREREELLRKYSVGSVVEFGWYFIHNGNVEEPLKWRVLARENDCALLITEKCIDCKPYHQDIETITWEECTLRQWLNSYFLTTAFKPTEQDGILTVNLPNNAGNDTKDRIFLLSVDEATKYFRSDEDRSCEVTQYAKSRGAWASSWNEGYWWLRSRGSFSHFAAIVSNDGNFQGFGRYVGKAGASVRPALWLNIQVVNQP